VRRVIAVLVLLAVALGACGSSNGHEHKESEKLNVVPIEQCQPLGDAPHVINSQGGTGTLHEQWERSGRLVICEPNRLTH